MKPSWDEIQRLFEQMLTVEPSDRERLLAAHCQDDAELLGAVRDLLRADAEMSPHFLTPRDSATPNNADPIAEEWLASRRIGAFRVGRVLGSGGMGIVYEATQDAPRRTVALKVLKPTHSMGSSARRFQHESEILARLRHPAIAQVIAAGVHVVASGPVRFELPWYAMDLLEQAVPITRYCAAHDLGPIARIELILPVLDAVHYAHQRGIIHRDLKPANIVVDAAGVARVIDFGIARETRVDDGTTAHTGSGELLGTLRYMAPEQLLDGSDSVDTRSDVYALGIVLYELLCGKPPYDVERLAPHRAGQHILEHEPRRPTQLRGDLPRELEWVLLRAIDKQPDRRYPSVLDLAEDLRRYLRREPLLAGPPSGLYRMAMFMRRHRRLVAATLIVVLSLCAALAISLVSLLRAQRAEREMSAQARRAEREAETSGLVIGFFNEAFAKARLEDRGRDFKVVDLLGDALTFARNELAGRPEVAAMFLYSLGRLNVSLGDFAPAEACLREAVPLFFSTGAVDAAAGTRLLCELVQCQMLLGRLTDAERTLASAHALLRRSGEADAALAERVRGIDGALWFRQGRYREAEAAQREILRERLQRLGPDHEETILAGNALSITLQELGRLDEAEPLARDVLERTRRNRGPTDPRTFLAVNNLATLLNNRGRSADARALLDDILPAAIVHCGEDHPTTNLIRSNLATACWRVGDRDHAIHLTRDVLERRRGHGSRIDELESVRNFASMLHAQGQSATAERLAREALASVEADIPADHPAVAVVRAVLGHILLDGGRDEDAEPLLLSAHRCLDVTHGPSHQDTRRVREWLHALYERRGDAARAAAYADDG